MRALSFLLLTVLSSLAGAFEPLRADEVVLTEIQPAPPAEYPEFIELHNPSAAPVDLSGYRISGAIRHQFPPGTSLGPFGYFVISDAPQLFRAAYGFDPQGSYPGGMPGDAGSIVLTDGKGRFKSSAVYRLELDSLATAGGASLELPSVADDGSWPGSWRTSLLLGGTPGRGNSVSVAYESEIAVPEGSEWRYWKGTSEPSGQPLDWTRPDYDDSSWSAGRTPMGFGAGEVATPLEDMRSRYTTVYLRRVFGQRTPARAADSLLSVLFDDGFVAYLNGVEVARRNLGEKGNVTPHDAVATARQEAEDVAAEVRLAGLEGILREGRNVLAVQAVNDHVRSSDFVISPSLSLSSGTRSVPPPPRVRLNELWLDGADAWIEIANLEAHDVDLGSARILRADGGGEAALAADLRAPAHGFVQVRVPRDLATWKLILVDGSGRLLDAIELPKPLDSAASGRFPDGVGSVALLPRSTPSAPNLAPRPGSAVITEIHYNPPEEDAELIEILATRDLELGGWSISGGIRYEFPDAFRLPGGSRVVVARNPSLIVPLNDDVKILGPYRGRLSNSGEEIQLLDPESRPIDVVRYADDGSWPSIADGGGKSLELADPSNENTSGSAWRASAADGGTPGLPNSAESKPGAVILSLVRVSPAVPAPGDAVRITARVEPDSAAVDLLWRLDGEQDLRRIPMTRLGDQREAQIPPQAAGGVLELALDAHDPGDPAAPHLGYPASSPGTFLVLIDDHKDSPAVPTYRLVLRARDLQAMRENVESDELRPASFVAEGEVYPDVKVRFRGHGSRQVEPKSYRVRFTEEKRFHGDRTILLNGFRPERQILGMDVWRRAGMPYSRARAVQLSVNGQFYPRYAEIEPIDEEYLERHYGDSTGNLYRGQRMADFTYLGESQILYQGLYEKHTNEEVGDWSDVVRLTRAFTESSEEEFPEAISRLIDVDEWIRWLAINAALSNQEGGLHHDTGDDYFTYRTAEGRFVLLPWDMDSTFLEPGEPIFRPSLSSIRRLITHPRFAPRYFGALEEATSTFFAPEIVARQTVRLAPAFSADLMDELGTFARDRVEYLRRSIPAGLTAGVARDGGGSGDTLFVWGDTTALHGSAPAAQTVRVLVNGFPAAYDPPHAGWSVELGPTPAEHRVEILALDSSGSVIAMRDTMVKRIARSHLVSSIVAGSNEWTRDGSPYVLSGELSVPAGSSLVIRPGARLLGLAEAIVNVEGSLQLLGAPDARITVESGSPDSPWQGLRFYEGSSGEIDRCDFIIAGTSSSPSSAKEAFIVADRTRLEVRSSTFRGIPRTVIDASDGELRVTDCSFLDTLEAIHGNRSAVVAEGNLIVRAHGNSDGIDLDGDATARGLESRIEANAILGVEDDGIDLFESSALILRNIIHSPGDRGISIEGVGAPRVEGNLVVGCVTGLALKDGVVAEGARNTITGCEAGLRAFIKNAGSAGASGRFHSSILRGSLEDVIVDAESRFDLDHSDVGGEPSIWGSSNLSVDPAFAPDGTFRLSPHSPCASMGRDNTTAGARGLVDFVPPEITAIEPAHGSVRGGELVVVTGTGLEGFIEVRFGGEPLRDAHWVPSGRIVGTLPPALVAGPVAVDVTTSAGFARAPMSFGYSRRLARGDATGDLRLNVSDAVAILRYLFAGAALPVCDAAADLTGDGILKADDAIFLLRYLFGSGPGAPETTVDCD